MAQLRTWGGVRCAHQRHGRGGWSVSPVSCGVQRLPAASEAVTSVRVGFAGAGARRVGTARAGSWWRLASRVSCLEHDRRLRIIVRARRSGSRGAAAALGPGQRAGLVRGALPTKVASLLSRLLSAGGVDDNVSQLLPPAPEDEPTRLAPDPGVIVRAAPPQQAAPAAAPSEARGLGHPGAFRPRP